MLRLQKSKIAVCLIVYAYLCTLLVACGGGGSENSTTPSTTDATSSSVSGSSSNAGSSGTGSSSGTSTGNTGSTTGTGTAAVTDAISGKIVISGTNTTLASVSLSLVDTSVSNGTNNVTSSDSHGSFSFGQLANHTYSITPQLNGYVFLPASQTVTLDNNAISNLNFLATPAATPLNSYTVAPNSVTVAGISSGASMAVQLQVAYSASIYGTALVAAAPYYCMQNSFKKNKTACNTGSGLNVNDSLSYANAQASANAIDATSNIANKPIYMFSGTLDTMVPQTVMDDLQTFYSDYTDASNITYNNTTPAEHAWISPDASNTCATLSSPFLNNCGLDIEQTFLSLFYGPLNAKSVTPAGQYIQFSQTPFCPDSNCARISLDDSGWLYVPGTCDSGSCKLVVMLHGCLQNQAAVGTELVQNSGINEWADTNGIIVLYPQTINSTAHPTNPSGCWDWLGYTGPNYALKSAPQMMTIMGMVKTIAGS